jgi:predicted MFS family arabinose efflux permease
MPAMPLQRYRAVMRAPGVIRLLLVGFLARGPVIAVGAVLTLHVVLTLHRDYASAGLAATAFTVASAVGAPWRGRAIDRIGLRRALVPAVVIGGGTWLVAPFASYPVLLLLAVVGGVFGLPSFAVVRQALSVAVGADHRRTALALDSISVELSFMTGPAIAVVAASTWSTRGTLFLLGVAQVVAGLLLCWLNPTLRSPEIDLREPVAPAGPPTGTRRHRKRTPRRWVTPGLVAAYATGTGTALVLAGSEVAVVAQLRHLGDLPFTGAVFFIWGVTSIVGGFVYGALHREIPAALVLLGLSILTLPISLARGPVSVALLIAVSGLFCAPALTATSTAVTRLVAEESRGQALGWQGTAMTLGSGLGAPLAGFAADHGGPGSGYVVAGLAGVGLALVALALAGATRRRRSGLPEPPATAASQGPATGRANREVGADEGSPRNTSLSTAADTLVD